MDNQKRKQILKNFQSLHLVAIPRPLKTLCVLLSVLGIILVLFLTFTPWIQTAYGEGVITTASPSDRPQVISAPVSGRINSWHVTEGARVKMGDMLAEIVDNDPNFIARLELEVEAARQNRDVTKATAETAKLDYTRRKNLFKQGLGSRHDYEKAKINYAEYRAKQAAAIAYLAQIETKRSRQETQRIMAPADGMIVRIRNSDTATFVKQGDIMAQFIPDGGTPLAEIFVRGLDAPLIHRGARVRLQFEGWPAVQFSGWPAISVGSFGGIVTAVDPSASESGRFRVLVKQDPSELWPNSNFLRYGARVNGWVMMEKVKVGYELWRQLNNFPPVNPNKKTRNAALIYYTEDESK
jgi:multidrug efflux pump subunit AcrA (membrane-fusion protein)